MIYELIVRAQVAEALREADKARLIEMIKTEPEDRTKPFLTFVLYRVGLITTC